MPDNDTQDEPRAEPVEVTCSGGIQIQTIGAGNGE
jgi:hypothetical protein